MSLTLAALIAAFLTTGLTSLVAHKITLLGGAAAALLFGALSLLNRNGRIYPFFVFGPLALCILCLVSTERNVAPGSSAIHILAAYAALAGLSASTPDFSRFCRRLILLTFAIHVSWVLVQTARVGRLEAWTVSAVASGGNLVAAQINMALPLVLYLAIQARDGARWFWSGVTMLGVFSVFCVMSRNGIGTLLVMGTLIALFNQKKTALFACSLLSMMMVFLNELMQNSLVMDLLVRFRFARFEAKISRSLIWSICNDYITSSPWLGIGPGISDRVLAVLDINHAHNNIIQVALECGIPAAIVAVILFGGLLQIPATALLRDRNAFILSLPIVAYFLISLTDNPIHHPQATLLLIACVNEARHAIERASGHFVSELMPAATVAQRATSAAGVISVRPVPTA